MAYDIWLSIDWFMISFRMLMTLMSTLTKSNLKDAY